MQRRLKAEPCNVQFDSVGDVRTVKLTNVTDGRLAFKVRIVSFSSILSRKRYFFEFSSMNNLCYASDARFGSVEARSSMNVRFCLVRDVKMEEKVRIGWAEVARDSMDAVSDFAAAATKGVIEIYLVKKTDS